ncbi:MAG: zinc-binding dehydrogenase [Solirubrobacteraceae bacterium]
MRAVIYANTGDASVLEVVERAAIEPAEGKVRIRVVVSGVNPTVSEDGPARLQPGALGERTVLVAGGAGAVGNAAIQLAWWAGARVITTVSSKAKAQLAGRAGAQHVVNYHDTDAADQIRRVAPAGVGIIIEVAAGSNAELDQSVIRPRGTTAIYANDGGIPFAPDVRANMALDARYQFVPALHRRLAAHRERRRRPSTTAPCESANRPACRFTASTSTTRPPLMTRWRAQQSERSSSRSPTDAVDPDTR